MVVPQGRIQICLIGQGAHLQACMCTVSSSGQRSSRQRSSAALLTSSAVSMGSASARLRTPDRPSRSVRSPAGRPQAFRDMPEE